MKCKNIREFYVFYVRTKGRIVELNFFDTIQNRKRVRFEFISQMLQTLTDSRSQIGDRKIYRENNSSVANCTSKSQFDPSSVYAAERNRKPIIVESFSE